MVDPTIAPLAGWESFYVIVGSSGAALIGLQFVVIALVSDIRESSHDQIGAFACIRHRESHLLSRHQFFRIGEPAIQVLFVPTQVG